MALHALLAGSVVAFAAVSLLGFAAGHACRRLIPREADRAGRRARLLLWVLLPATYVLALFAMTAGGWLDAVERANDAVPAGIAESFVGLVLVFGVPALAAIAPYLGLFPAIRAVRGLEMTRRAVLAVLLRYVAGFVVLVAGGLIAVFSIAAVAGPQSGYAVGVGVVLLGLYVASPLLSAALTATREPTEAERNRLDVALSRAGLSPRWVRVQLSRGSETATAALQGAPGARAVFVTDYLLDSGDDETLAAGLALRAERAARFHTGLRTLLVVGLFLAATVPWWTPSLPVPATAVQVGGVAASLAGLWAGRRLVFRADAAAADRLGTPAVRTAIERLVELNDAPRDRGIAGVLFRMEPSIEARLAQLAEADGDRTGRTPSTSGAPDPASDVDHEQ